MAQNITQIFDNDAQFIQTKLQSIGKTPLIWSGLCQCERDSLLAWLSMERRRVVIREAI